MKMKNKINLMFALILGTIVSKSQSIDNQVINSAGGGGSVGATGYEAYYNIGETVINTINNGTISIVTQGFLQPDIIGNFGLTAGSVASNITCLGKTDGFINITTTLSTISGPLSQPAYSVTYYWSPSSVCPTNDCASINGLVAGTYSVLVVSSCTSASVPIDSVKIQNLVIKDNFEPCILEIFNGITPNNDGHNDFFYLGNIDQYPDNVVDIYNRWGQHLDHITGYNNMDKKWAGTLNGSSNPAPAGTYFYIINLGDKKSKLIKGWIELLRE